MDCAKPDKALAGRWSEQDSNGLGAGSGKEEAEERARALYQQMLAATKAARVPTVKRSGCAWGCWPPTFWQKLPRPAEWQQRRVYLNQMWQPLASTGLNVLYTSHAIPEHPHYFSSPRRPQSTPICNCGAALLYRWYRPACLRVCPPFAHASLRLTPSFLAPSNAASTLKTPASLLPVRHRRFSPRARLQADSMLLRLTPQHQSSCPPRPPSAPAERLFRR